MASIFFQKILQTENKNLYRLGSAASTFYPVIKCSEHPRGHIQLLQLVYYGCTAARCFNIKKIHSLVGDRQALFTLWRASYRK